MTLRCRSNIDDAFRPWWIGFLLPVVLGIALGPASSALGQCQADKLLASDGDYLDSFGASIDIHLNAALIGAPGDDLNGVENAGSAYVFRFDGSHWTQETKLVASDSGMSALFGGFTAIGADVAAIGAMRDSEAGFDAGAAYVFNLEGSEWYETQKLVPSDATPQMMFGRVSMSGDVILVTASRDDYLDPKDPYCNAGSAYVFRYDGAQWLEETKLTASDADCHDLFGISGDVCGTTIVIGALLDDDAGSNAGSAYVYHYDGFNWNQQQKLIPKDLDGGEKFGISVALSDDIIVVGAPRDDELGHKSGSAYVYRLDGNLWFEEAKLTASDGGIWDQFGISVAIDGDVICLGASTDPDGGTDSGSAYLFTWNGEEWVELAKLTADEPTPFDYFGDAVAVRGTTAMVSAVWDDDNGEASGSVFVFDVTPPSGDLDCNGNVGVSDLLILLGSWGPCADCNDCIADLDGDCTVGVGDLLILLGNWG